MQTNINWARLKSFGNVKEVNVPWSTEEWEFISKAKDAIDKNNRVEAVRAGFLSLEKYEAAKKWDEHVKAERSPHELTADELLAKAKDVGVELTGEMDLEDLADAVAKALQPKKEKVTGGKKTK